MKKQFRVFILFIIVPLVLHVLSPGCVSGEIDLEPRARFKVQGTSAIMNGVINHRLPARVARLVKNHPEVNTIVLFNVPGSIDDEKNLEAARLVREANLATHVPSNGEIASGGVDFFLAGTTRTIEQGARLGVHSWGGNDEHGTPIIAARIPKDHKEHIPYLDYYRDMGIDEDFYWFTLNAAPAEQMHWMTQQELERFGFVTQ